MDLASSAPQARLLKCVRFAMPLALLWLSLSARADLEEFMSSCRDDVERRQANAATEADRIRSAAGVPDTEIVGVEPGQAVGFVGGSTLPITASMTILSEEDATSFSSGGDGSFNNPYTIGGIRLASAPDIARENGLIWDDPEGEYFVRLTNCEITGYSHRQIALNTAGGLFVEQCTITGASGATGIEVMSGDLYVYASEFKAPGENAIVLAGDGTKIRVDNSRFTDQSSDWDTGAAAVVIEGEGIDASLTHSESSGLLRVFVRLQKNPELLAIHNVETDGQVLVGGTIDDSRTLRFVIQNTRAKNCARECVVARALSNFDIGFSEFLNNQAGSRLVNLLDGPTNGAVHHSIFDNATPGPTGPGDENLEAWFPRDVDFAHNWSKRAPEDAFEFVAPQGNSTIRHSVGDNTSLQVIDVWGNPGGGRGAVIHHVYGDSMNDVGVLVTDANDVLVHDVYTRNTTGRWHNVTLEQRRMMPGSSPNGLRAYAPLPLASNSFTGSIFGVIGDVGIDNEALWFDESGIRTFGTPEIPVALASNVCRSLTFDGDGDAMPDAYEIRFGLNPENDGDARLDPDGDNLTNAVESTIGSSPFVIDTDGDGVNDGEDARPLDPRTVITAVPIVQISLDMDADSATQVVIDSRGESDGLTRGNVDCGMPGISGTACELSDRAYVESTAFPILQDGSVTLWMNSTAFEGPVLTLAGNQSLEPHVVLELTAAALTFAPSSSCRVIGNTESGVTSPGWHHIVGTWGGGRVRMYIDGQLVATTSCNATLIEHDRVILGIAEAPEAQTDTEEEPRLLIDEVQLFSTALGETDVASDCQLGRSDCRPRLELPPRAGAGATSLCVLLVLTLLMTLRPGRST